MGKTHGHSQNPGDNASSTRSALSHDGGKPAADDDALRVDRPRVGHQRAGSIPPAARPNLAVLSGPTERPATRSARVAGMSGEHARPGEDSGRHCRANAHEPAGDVVASQASHRCPLPARRPAPARPAFAPLHDSRGILRYLARNESFPRRTQTPAVPAGILQSLLPEHRCPRRETPHFAQETCRKRQCRRGKDPRLPE